MTRRAFTLIEVLVVVAIVALLLALALPALAGARGQARLVSCMSRQRQLVLAWHLYAGDFADRAMPLAYWEAKDIGLGPQVFWWGTHGTTSSPPDFARGFLAPYLDAGLHPGSVFECPAQPWVGGPGSDAYLPQGPAKLPTSTFGYNGYYLSPAKTPGWGATIGFRPWRRTSDVQRPTQLLVFADAMLALGGTLVKNSALLDPPMLHEGGGGGGGTWTSNPFPTTAFRHGRTRHAPGTACAARADASVGVNPPDPDALIHPWIGSVSLEPDPWYVPDWRDWP